MLQFILSAIGVVALSEISKTVKMPKMAKGGGVESPTNKEVWNNGDIIDYYPSDIGGSNQSQDTIIEYKGKKYLVAISMHGEDVIRPNAKASLYVENEEYAKGGGVGEDISKSLYVEELYDNNGNIMGYTVRDKFNVSGKYTLSSKKERAEEIRQYLIDNPSRLVYYRKNEYAKGGGVGIETKYDLKGWRKSQNKWVVINKNPMSYEEAQEMFESARKSGLYDTLSIESNMLKKPKYATFSVN